ncbi:FAD-dependent oxidoreductase [Rubripirellula sp.]|nr:FAD-dependent oxidoreductase [Rubripirellula sp.]
MPKPSFVILSMATVVLLSAAFVTMKNAAAQGKAQYRQLAPSYYQRVERGEQRVIECDVAVYGGTPAGVTAAIQASREGKKSVLISFNQHVGGMTSGGLTATDLGKKESIGGLALEFYNRIGKQSNFRPSQAESLYLKMLEEAGVMVLTGRALESVGMEGSRLLWASMETGELIRGKVFVDSTYEGDLLAATNISYRVGREPAVAYDESLAGQWQTISWKDVYQFCRLPLSPYVEIDNPRSGLLPEIASEEFGEPGEGDYRVQAYNFRMYLSDKVGKIPFPKPLGYEPDRYSLLARFLNAESSLRWTLNYTTVPMTDGPVQMRNGDSNNAGSFSSDYVGGNYQWPDGTYQQAALVELPPPRRGMPVPLRELYELREDIFQDHVRYQQGLMFFLSRDPRVPKELRDRVNRFGLDPNEFQRTGHWPHQLYVREGRRMVSDYVITQADCESKKIAPDSIALASYAMDSHFCQRVVVEEGGKTTVRNEGGFGHGCPRPYPISYRAIIPKREECVNLLVPVCLSSSHVAYGSIRMEPIFMILGQSAGTAAAFAIEDGIALQDLDYAKLKAKLERDEQRLIWQEQRNQPAKQLAGLIIDDAEATKSGDWTLGTLAAVCGPTYLHDNNRGKGEKTMTFDVKVPKSGKYQLKLLYVANPNRSTKTQVDVVVDGRKDELVINQRASDKTGKSLGTYRVEEVVTVTVSNRDTDGFVVVDGLQLLSKP